ncbi:MAG TPA: hypothetical protein VFQ61_33780 [Polyangiaceae bacterium]|nr:hypothetical protein [Polyangiaceae bacterium]
MAHCLLNRLRLGWIALNGSFMGVSCIGMSMAVVASLSGCRETPGVKAQDTEGRRFSIVCEGESACTVRVESGDPAFLRLASNGRLVGVCEARSSHPADCRALVCTHDGECPTQRGVSGTCVGGLCVDSTHDLATDDAAMLCLWGTGLGHESREQIERYALAANCGSPCVIPKPCER